MLDVASSPATGSAVRAAGPSRLRRRRPHAALVALLATVLLALSPGAAAAGGAWTDPVRILATDSAPAHHDTVVDGAGGVHVAIQRSDRRGVWYASDRSGEWRVQRVTMGRDVEPAITIDRGRVVIAFARLDADGRSRGIFSASRKDGAWVIERQTGGGRKPDIDAHRGVVHLAFQDDEALWYMRVGGSPQDMVGYCCVGAPSLRVNDRGRPFIAASLTYGTLVLGRLRDTGDWLFQVIESARTRAPELVHGELPTVGYLHRRDGPTVRVFQFSQVNNVGSWQYVEVSGGLRPFDLITDRDTVSTFALGREGGKREGRIVQTTFGNDFRGVFLVPRVRGATSVDAEVFAVEHSTALPVVVYGRRDGLWETRVPGAP